MVKELNYLEVYTYKQWTSSTKEIPVVEPGEEVRISKAGIGSGKTAPPPKLTETELIALMDRNGIGTDATIAEHIEKIIARNYITKSKERGSTVLNPTSLGYGLVEGFSQIGFDSISLTKPFLRKKLEDKLKMICDGATTKPQVCQEILDMYREAFALANQNKRLILQCCEDAERNA
ncbi:unnamed protein product [Ambrosiozyma monospora]|uniref:DNA topoisomerase n=1 Tax=Ambrosiozyma monospora TaxID=43982 RepID=A0A9W6Z607_AMBMO|nr:unnamed protein product [Ambrosiozyma monospora]